MKNVIVKAATLCVLAFSASAFAEKMTVTGEAIVLDKQGDVYVVPETFKVSPTFQYVVVDGTKRACFTEKQTNFGDLDVVTIDVKLGAEKASWNCYALDAAYFDVK